MNLKWLIAGAALVATFTGSQLRAQSALDGFDPNPDSSIDVIVVQPDGKILIGGTFTTLSPNGGPTVTRNHIARLNADGTLDSAFNPNANDSVNCIALQPDGKILVGGFFKSNFGEPTIGGEIRNFIARLDPITGLADSFNPNANFNVYSIAVPPDGRILVGGSFTAIGGQSRSGIARLDPTTGLADSFAPAPSGSGVHSIALQEDGKILVAGIFFAMGGQSRKYIARLDATTGLADSFNPNPSSFVQAMAVQPDGKILVVGMFSGANSIGGQSRNYIARLDPITGLADSFNPNANDYTYSIALQADGKVLVGGFFSTVGGQTRHHIARLDATTGLADAFDPNPTNGPMDPTGPVFTIAVHTDGKILAGGDFDTLAPNGGAAVTRHNLARLEIDGRLDQNLNGSVAGSSVHAIAIQPDGKILVGGDFYMVSGVSRNNLARLNTDGTLDSVFNPPMYPNTPLAVAVQTDGKILAAGYIFSQSSVAGITRFNATTGTVDDSFHPATNNFVLAMALQPDGKILIVGGFSNSVTLDKSLSRLNTDGSLDTSFDPKVTGGALCVTLQADGKILVGGFFTSVAGQTRNHIARLNPDGTLDAAFNPNADDLVTTIAVQADGKILVAGNFSNIGGQTRSRIARLEATTGAADSFDAQVDSTVSSIVIQADTKIVIAGSFENIGGQMRNHIARLDATTGLADSFNPNVSGGLDSMAVAADGKIVVGGNFSSIGGTPRFNFARLSNDTAALQNLAVTHTGISWTRGGSSPQFVHVTFESSTDNVNYAPLGEGTRAGSNWILNGLSLPAEQNIFIRVRGYCGTGQNNGSESLAESVRKVFLRKPATLRNISTRVRVQTGDNAMIGGFIVTGTQQKTVIVRGIGPSLLIAGALADPVIEVHDSGGQLVATNDNWNDAATRQQIIDSGLAPSHGLESALWGVLNPGAYTVLVRGNNNSTGIGLFEVYDLDPAANSKLANVATRGFVETGDNVMIGGAIVRGEAPARVLLRAIGPSLTNFGITNALADPVLTLYDGNGELVAINYDWRDDQDAEIAATGLPPSNDRESAIVKNLAPGNYTAIVRGSDNTMGVALIEAYDVD